MLLLRALLSFLVLPGVAAGIAPAGIVAIDPWRGAGWRAGLGILALGVVVLLICVRDFLVAGRGTLAPWDPPKRLVVVGLYRHVRNPMYVGVLAIVAGWAVAAGSPLLVVYTAAFAAIFHGRVLLHEEPWLARTFPDDWALYRAGVRRWLPRATPWRDPRARAPDVR